MVLDHAPCLAQAGLAEAALRGFHLLHFEACSQERGKVSCRLWMEQWLVCMLHTLLLTYVQQDNSNIILVLVKNKTNK